MMSAMDRTERIISDIGKMKKPGKRLVIAIDGRCGTGKTYLAREIQKRIGCSVVHADDFSVPFEMKTEERLSIPGGNLHSERMIRDVFERLSEPVFSFHPFDYSIGRIADRLETVDRDVLIIEGSYSLLPELRKYYDKCYIIEEPLDLRLERIRRRAGEERFQMFLSRWIPLEEKYWSSYDFTGIEVI